MVEESSKRFGIVGTFVVFSFCFGPEAVSVCGDGFPIAGEVVGDCEVACLDDPIEFTDDECVQPIAFGPGCFVALCELVEFLDALE